MRQTMFRDLRIFILLSLFVAAVVHSVSGGEVQSEKRPIASFQPDDQIKSAGSQNESSFRSFVPGHTLVTDVLDGGGGESRSAGYAITVSSGGQAAVIGISESNNYQAYSGFTPAVQVKRGDVNETGVIDVGDVIHLINYLYRRGSIPIPLESGDCNCDGVIDIGDVIYLINYLFRQGLPPCAG